MPIYRRTVNYKKRLRKKVDVLRKKKSVLAVLLAGSVTLNALAIGSDLYELASSTLEHNDEVERYEYIIDNHIHRTNDKQNWFINTFCVAQDLKSLEVKDREEFYHTLISVALNIRYDKNKNFKQIIDSLNLDSLAKENSVYPTEAEFEEYLQEFGLIDENGVIDFDRWKSLDKDMFEADKTVDSYRM